MKVLKQWSFGVLFLLSFSNLQAQYREVGLVTSASMGIMYGPVLDARPVYKWGNRFLVCLPFVQNVRI